MFYVAYGEDVFDELVSKMKKDMKERVKLNKDHKTMIKIIRTMIHSLKVMGHRFYFFQNFIT